MSPGAARRAAAPSLWAGSGALGARGRLHRRAVLSSTGRAPGGFGRLARAEGGLVRMRDAQTYGKRERSDDPGCVWRAARLSQETRCAPAAGGSRDGAACGRRRPVFFRKLHARSSDRWLASPGRPTSGPRCKRVTRANGRGGGGPPPRPPGAAQHFHEKSCSPTNRSTLAAREGGRGEGPAARGAAAFPPCFEGSYLVDPASSHMLVSKIKPCMSKYKLLIL